MQGTPRNTERASAARTLVDAMHVNCDNLRSGATGTTKVETFSGEGADVTYTMTRTCTASAFSTQGLPPEE